MSHPNDTLNGELLKWEREEDKRHRNRFGYWRMVEERMHRAKLAEQGIMPGDRGYYLHLCKLIEQTHKNDTAYQDRHGLASFGAVRQQAAFERNAMIREATDECIAALRQIRDGHNNAPALAAEVLAKLEGLDVGS